MRDGRGGTGRDGDGEGKRGKERAGTDEKGKDLSYYNSCLADILHYVAGEFGVVYKARLLGVRREDEVVAVKTLKGIVCCCCCCYCDVVHHLDIIIQEHTTRIR